MKRPTITLLVAVVAVAAVVAGCADGGAADADGGDAGDDDCSIGVVLASSLTFEERLCVTRASTEEGNRFVIEAGTRFSWDVQEFGGDEPVLPLVLDVGNSGAFGHFDRDGLSWVVSSGGIGGQPQGQSTLTVDAVEGGAFAGHLDGAAVPDFNNETLDSVFVTVDVSAP
jgi:hypothetical protein